VTTNDTVYDVVNGADQFAAGFGNVVSFGKTNQYRQWAYGESATRNHQGWLYNTGQVGGAITLALLLKKGLGNKTFLTVAGTNVAADLVFPDGVQAPMNPCDKAENLDNSHKRALLELGLGMGIDAAPTLGKGLLNSADNLLNSIDDFRPPSGWGTDPVPVEGYLPNLTNRSSTSAWDWNPGKIGQASGSSAGSKLFQHYLETRSNYNAANWQNQLDNRGSINIDGDILPARVQNTDDFAHGLLLNPQTGNDIMLESGRTNPKYRKLLKKTISTLVQQKRINFDVQQSLGHVEGIAAAILRSKPEISRAEVKINVHYICQYCERGVENILNTGQTLVVKYSPDGGKTIIPMTFVGK
jgi:hypothetical protein